MSNLKRLQTFTFSDNFGWSFAEVQAEALVAANRRADMMGWTDVIIKPVSTIPTTEGAARNYNFEIWGIGEAIIDPYSGQELGEAESTGHRQVARESDINP